MVKLQKNLCNSFGITEDSLPNRNRFIYNGDEERKQLTDPIRHDNNLTCSVVSYYTKLTKKTPNKCWWLCLLHEETHSSFIFSKLDAGWFFYCFGCEKNGDLIALVMLMERIGFHEALQILWAIKMKLDRTAKIPVLKGKEKKKGSNKTLESIQEQAPTGSQKSSIKSNKSLFLTSKASSKEEIEKECKKKIDKEFEEWANKQNYLTLYHYITESCHKYLLSDAPDPQKALNYLLDRGFTMKIIREHQIGFYQKKAMFPYDAGFTLFGKDNLYPYEQVFQALPKYFDGYILFPLRDSKTSDVLGFQGRLFGEGEPKYVITGSNKYFSKSEHLYLMNEAIDAIQEKGSVNIVEGVFDALLMHLFGCTNTVALLGRSISDKQISLIEKYIPTNKSYRMDLADVTTFFDNDLAGIDASIQIYEKFKKTDLFVLSITTLPQWKDPADWIRDIKKIRPPYTYKGKQHEGALPFRPIYPDFGDYIKKEGMLSLK